LQPGTEVLKSITTARTSWLDVKKRKATPHAANNFLKFDAPALQVAADANGDNLLKVNRRSA